MCLSGQVYDGELRGRVDLQRDATAVRLRSADEQLFRVDCGVSRPETKMYESGGSGAGTKLKCLLTDGDVLHMIHISRLPVKSIHQGRNIRPRTLGRQSNTTKAGKKTTGGIAPVAISTLSSICIAHGLTCWFPRQTLSSLGRVEMLSFLGFFDGGWSVGHKTQGRSLIALSSWSGFSVTSDQAR